jgi:hypothetical protein
LLHLERRHYSYSPDGQEEETMPKQTDDTKTILAAVQPMNEITVLPPDSGFLGRFLSDTENMLKARAMRMGGLLRRINESGQRTENMLRMAAERMEATHAKLEKDLRREGLAPNMDDSGAVEAEDE